MNEGTTGTDIHYLSGNELLWDQHNTRPINGRSWLQPFFLIKRHKHTLFKLGFDFGFVLRTPTLRAGSQFRIEINKAQIKELFRIPQSAFVDADFSDNQTDILPLELESKEIAV